MSVTEIFHYLTSSQDIIQKGGLILLLSIVYVENGWFFGFFLPGDYLLFTAGVLSGTGDFEVGLVVLLLSVASAAILGSWTGYWFGRTIGKKMLHAEDSFFFKREYIIKTRAYYIKYAGNTLLVGRFLPIVRTFAPILAGMVNMSHSRFLFYNILGGCVWAFSLISLGYFLGSSFPGIMNYLHYFILGFIAITSIVVIKGFFTAKKKIKSTKIAE